ncbi:MAG: hypothetical protein WKF66_15400 [Pedobacter sp.]
MKNKYEINDLNGLKARQMALLAESDMHAEAVLMDSKSYVQDFSLSNLIKRKPEPVLNISLKKPDSSAMLSGKILSLALPIILNKTIFKGSGFITKAAVTFISSKTGAKLGGRLVKYINRLKK